MNLFWPILLQVYAPFGVLLQGGGVPKLTNVWYALGSSELDKRISMIELHEEPVHVANKREESTAGKSKNHVLPSKKNVLPSKRSRLLSISKYIRPLNVKGGVATTRDGH